MHRVQRERGFQGEAVRVVQPDRVIFEADGLDSTVHVTVQRPERQPFGGERQTHRISRRVRKLCQAIEKPQGLEHGCVDADADPVIAGFDASRRRAARKRTLGHDRCRDAAASPRVSDICAQLAKAATHCHGGSVWSRHVENSYSDKAD
jgi:hypothetical protein